MAILQTMEELTSFSSLSKVIFLPFGAMRRGQSLGTTVGVRNLCSALLALQSWGPINSQERQSRETGPCSFYFPASAHRVAPWKHRLPCTELVPA